MRYSTLKMAVKFISGVLFFITLSLFPCRVCAFEKSVLPSEESHYLRLDLLGGLLNDRADYSNVSGVVGFGGAAGWRGNSLGAFIGVEKASWVTHNLDLGLVNGVLNFYLGGEFLFFENRVRSSVSFGTSTLLFDTVLDSAGTSGIFADIRPVSIRFSRTRRVVIEFCPISASLSAPVLGERSLKKLEYRMYLSIEVPI